MSYWKKKTGVPPGHLMWLLPPLKSVQGAPQTNHMLFLISCDFSSQWCLLPWWAGLYLVCFWGPSLPSSTSPFCLFGLAPSCFLHNLHPSQVGGVPRSGIYTHSKARKKDRRDPREKKFPSLVLFIILLLLPLKAPPYSTVAPLCILGHSIFSCTCNSSFVGREESV